MECQSRPQGGNLEHVRVVAWQFFRQVDSHSLRVTRPQEIGIRRRQSDFGDLAAAMKGNRSKRLYDQFPVVGPSQRDGTQVVAFGGKPNVARDKLWALGHIN